MPRKGKASLPRSECLCAICREILLEPVTLPCNHTLCHPCFKNTVEKASLCCPFCRQRVSNWARHNARSGTLINKALWKIIQRQYPEDCRRRANGQDAEEDEFEDGVTSYPTPLLCKPGEIRQEYEAEISKIESERLSREEEERKASEAYIQKLLAEEEEEQRLSLERTQRDLEEQLKRDEELARILNNDLNESTASSDHVASVGSPVIHKQISSKSCKNVKGKAKLSGDIERFLSPTKTIGIQGSNPAKNTDVLCISSSMDSSAFVMEDSDEDAMPTLSPQTFPPNYGRILQDSGSELQLPCLIEYSSTETYQDGLQTPGPSRSTGAASQARNKEQSNTATMDFSPPRSSNSLDGNRKRSSSECNNVLTSTPEQWLKVTPKRALDSSGHLDDHGTEKRQKVSYLENSAIPGFHTERLMELEEGLGERKIQEEQDRLLAIKLQKLLDKDVKQVRRQKGSPDEYKLRPKRSIQQQEPTDLNPLKSSVPKDIVAQTKGGNHKSEDTSDENKKPAPKKRVQNRQVSGSRARTTSAGSLFPDGVKVLRQSNKQQTILDMFERVAGK
ncbi:E3 ubiquitin-protein ligase RNF168 [Mixophyes fleayi]|uniref:E3 ubiquitin-protein ligase RNF168 n=1 Tax=Mixophyes fleayi TaxID=3061075 RepID=UPI003F4DFDDF